MSRWIGARPRRTVTRTRRLFGILFLALFFGPHFVYIFVIARHSAAARTIQITFESQREPDSSSRTGRHGNRFLEFVSSRWLESAGDRSQWIRQAHFAFRLHDTSYQICGLPSLPAISGGRNLIATRRSSRTSPLDVRYL